MKPWAKLLIRIVAAATAGLAVVPATSAATIFVADRTDDPLGPGACSAAPNDCSLRQALLNANLSAGNTVQIPAGSYQLTIPGSDDVGEVGDLDVTKAETIAGAGPTATTINANAIDRVIDFQTSSGDASSLSGVTLTGGLATDNDGGGGIIQRAGTLSVSNSVITANKVMAGGGNGGGGIRSVDGSLNVDTTTIDGNVMTLGEGGGIYTGNTILNITRSTISGNSATGGGDGGAGIYNQDTLTIVNTTVSGNNTDKDGGGIDDVGFTALNSTIAGNTASLGGGFATASGTTRLENSILAGNSAPTGPNCDKGLGTIISQGHNIDSGTSCALSGSGDLSNSDPLLAPLAENGGPTPTRALGAGSPAIDAADASACPSTDQRGIARPQLGGCDIGAYEFVPTPPPADKIAPVASRLAVNPRSFAPTRSGGSLTSRKHKRVARGTKVSYRLSELAKVAFTVEKRVKGRKKGRRCKPRRKKGRRCTIYKAVPGRFTVQGVAGSNRFKFSGRMNKKPLKRGKYRLVGTPTDAAGNHGGAVRTAFRIVR